MATFRPERLEEQLPATRCVINGVALGGANCSPCSTAMLINRATIGAKDPSGCDVRRRTGDTSGGTTLPQMAGAARAGWDVDIAVFTGSRVGSPKLLRDSLRAGRPALIQIGTRPVLGTTFRSTAGAINHMVYVNEVRGDGAGDDPLEALIYDPAADGRDRSYHVDQGPSWWPWALVVRAAAALQPWGESDPRTLGLGRIYMGLGPDTEPHVVLRYGGKRTTPFPDRTRAIDPAGNARVNVRSRPTRVDGALGRVVALLDPGDLFVAYQVTLSGAKLDGSSVWYGSQSGDRWVHVSGLRYTGGTT